MKPGICLRFTTKSWSARASLHRNHLRHLRSNLRKSAGKKYYLINTTVPLPIFSSSPSS